MATVPRFLSQSSTIGGSTVHLFILLCTVTIISERQSNPVDPRVSAEALAAAETWENACSIFLRESAVSYLLLLREEGLLP